MVATLAIALWLGGLLALGAFAAPTVFGLLPREEAGKVMGPIFVKFDRFVLVAIGVFALSELIRVACDGGKGALKQARLGISVILIALALISSLWLTPGINELFLAGARRGIGEAGATLDMLHNWSETVGKVATLAAAIWIALGVIVHRQGGTSHAGSHP